MVGGSVDPAELSNLTIKSASPHVSLSRINPIWISACKGILFIKYVDGHPCVMTSSDLAVYIIECDPTARGNTSLVLIKGNCYNIQYPTR